MLKRILLSLLIPFSLLANENKQEIQIINRHLPAYNEVYSNAQYRKPYQNFVDRSGIDINRIDPIFAQKLTTFPMNDKIKIYPVPLILSKAEYSKMIQATQQRARALREFFYDVIIGEGKIFGHLNMTTDLYEPLTEEFVESLFKQIWNRNSLKRIRHKWKNKKKEDINFLYGPDAIRAPNGEWVFIEDNIGYLGGLIDAQNIEEFYFRHHPSGQVSELRNLMLNRNRFLEDVISEFASKKGIDLKNNAASLFAKKWLSEKIESDDIPGYAYTLNNSWLTQADHEYNRLANVFRNLEIPIWHDSDSLTSDNGKMEQLSENIKFFFMRSIYSKWDDTSVFENLFRKTEDLAILPAPDTEVLSNKALMPYMNEFISFYLGEKPILRQAETKLFYSTKHSVDLHQQFIETIDKLDSDKTLNYVVKHPDGSQGSDVTILNKLNKKQLQTFSDILGYQTFFSDVLGESGYGPTSVLQEYIEPSFIPVDGNNGWLNLAVDIRPITVVLGDQITTRERPWGRGSFKLGHNLNNVSQGAFEIVVLVEDTCQSYLISK
ncbi:MAG: circularly permuted type 2 ATP-grasp protein [Halobacteriovoraceae bacterium]|nr:circularly permuted type 2 ATP-grasp protein [Halobacteriovoraceae bacterium]